MELASILLMAIVAVVLLIVTLVQIAGMRKTLQEIKEMKAAPAPAPAVAPAPSSERFERKGGDFRRHEKRPYQDQRPRPQQQQQQQAPAPAASTPVTPVDPVETSLRDINLRLKNAERDQESARKKIQENLGDRDQHHRGHDRDRSDRDRGDRGGDRNRDGGDRDGGRDRNRGRDGNRDRNRGPRRDNWQPQGNRSSSQQSASPAASPVAGDEQPTFEKQPFASTPSAPPATFPAAASVESNAPSMSAVTESPVFSPDIAPTQQNDQTTADYSGTGEDMEHGRKVLVKRRPLRDEGSEGSDQNSAKEEAAAEPSVSSDTEIQFGRRKGL